MMHTRRAIISSTWLVAFGIILVSSKSRCKYDKKEGQWSECDLDLGVRTKSIPLLKGKEGCPKMKTITRPCIQKNSCVYTPVSRWSKCNPDTLTARRTLELNSGSSKDCSKEEMESRDCTKETDTGRVDKKRKGKKGRGKHRKPRNRKSKGCRYKKGQWSNCHPKTRESTRILTLRNGPSSCRKKKKVIRPCQDRSDQSKGGRGEGKKSHRKRGKKHKKSKESSHASEPKPLQLREMRVWPSSKSIEVAWVPPDHGSVDGYIIGYGISFPDIFLIEVNASVLHYTIPNLEPEQEYIISLRARNKVGQGASIFETVRTGRSEDSDSSGSLLLPPVSLQADTLSSDAVRVSWKDSSVLKLRGGMDPHADRLYTVRYFGLNQDNFPRPLTQNTTASPLVVRGLNPNTRYQFAVRVSQGAAKSMWSMSVSNTTLPAVSELPSEPRNFSSRSLSHKPDAVMLTWQQPELGSHSITGYLIFYTDKPDLPVKSWSLLGVKGDRLNDTVANLRPHVQYFFRLQARTQAGYGPPTPPISYSLPAVVTSAPETLSAPEGLSVAQLATGSDAVVVKWLPAVSSSQPITGYIVMYSEEFSIQWSAQAVEGLETSCVVRPLAPDTTYRFKVRAQTDDQHGPVSPVVTFTTPVDPASSLKSPTDLKVYILSSTSAIMSWRNPMHDAAPSQAQTPHADTNQSFTYTVRYGAMPAASDAEPAALNYTYLSPPFFPSLYLVDLRPHTRYQFSVRLNRGPAHSAWSQPVVNTTLEAAPSSHPVNVSVSLAEDDSSMALIAWQPPLLPNGVITGYLVFMSRDRRLALEDWQVQEVAGGRTWLTVGGLAPSTKYFFKLQARNAKGYGPLTPVVAYKTPKVYGKAVEDVTVTTFPDDPFSASIRWQPPPKSKIKRRITHYLIVRKDLEGRETVRERVAGDTLTAVSRQLLPARIYRFTVQPKFKHASGPHSAPVDFVVPKERYIVDPGMVRR